MEPTFAIAGGQRCGTTSLYHLLDLHPDIFLAKPVHPEPKFFLRDPAPGRDRAWYIERWFSDASDAKAAGEKSTSYMENSLIPAAVTAMMVINFHHYVVDGMIWKRRKPAPATS